ncbi:MAG TPA: glycosyltransferase family 2 protein [Candidatus Krumholzibacteria bacterium]|nr:glycosyltransferase family 2 protein [Candidatus Krumholzibacteria bacterium]
MGLPVYNGERFLGRAIDTLLAQTYRDFELIIVDNASSDGTEDICRAYAQRDRRIHYWRNGRNLGAMGNFRRVFELARGELFKWAAHDDEHEPAFLEKCVTALDGDPGLVLAYTQTRDIDADGATLGIRSTGLDTNSEDVAHRFRALVRRDYPCVLAFGVSRANMLRRTRLLQDYADCDRVLLAEIGLAGRIIELPDPLFVRREHKSRSVWQFRSRQTRSAWFDPSHAGKPSFPYTRQLLGYMSALGRAPISTVDRMRCGGVMAEWLGHNGNGLVEDMVYATRYALRPLKRRMLHEPRPARPARPAH